MIPEYKTAEEKFYDRYPSYPRVIRDKPFEYIGVGAMMRIVSPGILKGGATDEKQNNRRN